MLGAGDISGLSLGGSRSHPTLGDLTDAILADRGISDTERDRLMRQLRGAIGSHPPSASLSLLLSRGAGGILGYLVARYFGMGAVSRLLAAVVGAGVGGAWHNRRREEDPYRGYRLLG